MIRWLIVAHMFGAVWADEPMAVVHPGVPFEAHRTVILTPVFQAGWDAMNRELGGPPKESGNELAKKLDEFKWKPESVLPEGCWQVWSGPSTTEFFNQVNKEAAKFMFKEEGPFQEVVPDRPGGVAFYSLLDVEVEFVRPFFRSRKWPMEFRSADGKSKEIRYWGVASEESEEFSGSVRVLSWRPQRGFHAVELRSRSEEVGSVILFMPPEPMSFERSSRWIRVWREGWEKRMDVEYGSGADRFLHRNDKLRVPHLRLDVSSDFAGQLQGDRVYGRKGDPFRLSVARQRVEFELDERGARLQGVAEGGIDPFAGPPPTVPRDFSFDRPFFVFLWRDGAEWPYFAAWIGDSAGMTEFGK
jgi:hypothetical protein